MKYLYEISVWNIYMTYLYNTYLWIRKVLLYLLWHICEILGYRYVEIPTYKCQIINPILPPNIDWLNSQRGSWDTEEPYSATAAQCPWPFQKRNPKKVKVNSFAHLHGSLVMSPLNITQPLGIWSINVYNGYYFWWCPIFPKWDIYQPLICSTHFADWLWLLKIHILHIYHIFMYMIYT